MGLFDKIKKFDTSAVFVVDRSEKGRTRVEIDPSKKGAVGGVAAGATVGAIFGPVGAAIGGVVGGVIGGIFGPSDK